MDARDEVLGNLRDLKSLQLFVELKIEEAAVSAIRMGITRADIGEALGCSSVNVTRRWGANANAHRDPAPDAPERSGPPWASKSAGLQEAAHMHKGPQP